MVTWASMFHPLRVAVSVGSKCSETLSHEGTLNAQGGTKSAAVKVMKFVDSMQGGNEK